MKKTLAVILASVMLLCGLSGCGQTLPTVTSTLSSGTAGIDPEPPEAPGNRYADYDPDREIYITAPNAYFSYYELYSRNHSVRFYILTKEPLDPEDIEVSIPCRSPYKVSVFEMEDLRDTQYARGFDIESSFDVSTWLPYYVYQCYRGVDFKKLKQLYDGTYGREDFPGASSEDSTGATEAEKITYNEYLNAELEHYKALKPEDLPEFYAYMVDVFLAAGETYDETIREMEVRVKDSSYHFDIGEVNLITGDQFALDEPVLSISGPTGQFQQLYNDGLGKIWMMFAFTAEEDMVLTELEFLDDDFEILDLYVTIMNGNQITNFFWDGSTPIDIVAGDEFYMDLIFRNEHTDELCYNVKLHAILHCETASGSACMWEENYLTPINLNLHELYAITFDGIDMESYYRDYFYPVCESWREEYLQGK